MENMENNTQDQGSNGKMMLLVGGVIVIIVVVVVVILFVMNGEDASDDSNNSETSEETAIAVAVTQEAVDQIVDELQSSYNIGEWNYVPAEYSTSEDGRIYLSFISPESDAIFQLQVGEDANKGVFSMAQLNFLISSYTNDPTDETDALATMRSVFGFGETDVEALQAEVNNLVDQFNATGTNQSATGRISETASFALQVGSPEDGSDPAGILVINTP